MNTISVFVFMVWLTSLLLPCSSVYMINKDSEYLGSFAYQDKAKRIENFVVSREGLERKDKNETILAWPVVNTTSGLLKGSTLEDSHAFYSIPYAEEPQGWFVVCRRLHIYVETLSWFECNLRFIQNLSNWSKQFYLKQSIPLNNPEWKIAEFN